MTYHQNCKHDAAQTSQPAPFVPPVDLDSTFWTTLVRHVTEADLRSTRRTFHSHLPIDVYQSNRSKPKDSKKLFSRGPNKRLHFTLTLASYARAPATELAHSAQIGARAGASVELARAGGQTSPCGGYTPALLAGVVEFGKNSATPPHPPA